MRQRVTWFVAGALIVGLLASISAQADVLGNLGRITGIGRGQSGGLATQALLSNPGAVDRALNDASGPWRIRDGATKVVPILSVGQGAVIGAAQVTGPAAAVDRVQGVLQVNVALFGPSLQASVLVPVDTRNLGGTIHRVGQVGVAATLGLRL